MDTTTDTTSITELDRELGLLEHIEHDPDITQANLADLLGVAVGTVNWHMKRLIAKGYIKVKRAQRRKLRYIITPEGLALRANLTVNYVENSMKLYRRTRLRVRELLGQVKQAGFDMVSIEGEGDIADICRLTCLEQGVKVIDRSFSSQGDRAGVIGSSPETSRFPVLEVHGTRVVLRMQTDQSATFVARYLEKE